MELSRCTVIDVSNLCVNKACREVNNTQQIIECLDDLGCVLSAKNTEKKRQTITKTIPSIPPNKSKKANVDINLNWCQESLWVWRMIKHLELHKLSKTSSLLESNPIALTWN